MPTTLVVLSSEDVSVTPPATAPGLTVVPLHIVAPAITAPTLVNGRPT